MRFTIEQRHLTDAGGRPTAGTNAVAFFTRDADDAAHAAHLFIGETGAEIIGQVQQFPGLHAIATMRKRDGVFTLQVSPASQPMPPV